jgi:hypothetical protein
VLAFTRTATADPAARFLFMYGPPAADGDEAPLMGFCHFRFTLQGELLEQMEGLPVLLISELFFVPAAQRKGAGSHVVNLLTLVARACNMAGVSVSMYTALAPACTPFLMQKLKGFSLDAEWTPDDAGLTVYYKPAAPLPPSAPATPAAAAAPVAAPATSSPDSVLAQSASPASPASPDGAARGGAAAGVALAAQFERVSMQDAPAPAPAAGAAVPFWASVAAPQVETVESASESEEDDEDEDEDEDERADRLLDDLCVLFEERNGRAPTEEEVQMWKATLAEASTEGTSDVVA